MKKIMIMLMLTSISLVQAADRKEQNPAPTFEWWKYLTPANTAPAEEIERKKQRQEVKEWGKIAYKCVLCQQTLTNKKDGSIENHTMRKHNACYDCDFKGSPETVENHRIAVHLSQKDVGTMVEKK